MDAKWIEKDSTLQKTYNDTAEKNPVFKEKYPSYNTFCETISDKYKSEAKPNAGEQNTDKPNTDKK